MTLAADLIDTWHLDLAATAFVIGCVAAMLEASSRRAFGSIAAARSTSAPHSTSASRSANTPRSTSAARSASTRVSLVTRSVAMFHGRVPACAGLTSVVLCAWFGGIDRSRLWAWGIAALVPMAFVDRADRPAAQPARRPADQPRRRPDFRSTVHPLGSITIVLVVASLVGVWSAVPDTEPALATAFVLVPMVVARPGIGPATTAALTISIVGTVWTGSAGWESALAVVYVVGMVVLAPVFMGFGTRTLPAWRAPWSMIIGAHIAVVLLTPRLVMRLTVGWATVTAVALVVAMGAMVVVASTLVDRTGAATARSG